MKLNKWVKRLLKVVLAIALFSFAMLFYLTGGKFFAKSGISNCVIVNNEKDFTGDRLKHSKSLFFSRIPTNECIAKDQQIDNGDGSRKGKVRWVECTYGPDCDEAGMF
ncbi:MAG: hypothetical protein COX19_09920 [Desulfobacterales bacterium CG23_combo_of_CG06-09_8_20_14_all_51_8]|nr:MAG: hypothetical protein COX19_09920 [Desulfobacterales bacterium CG23_combo_of_CG06-09_8_20_14_all_51_8]